MLGQTMGTNNRKITDDISNRYQYREGERRKKKLKDNKIIEIDSDIYEYLAILGMKLGQDNVNDFINDILLFQLKKLQKNKQFLNKVTGVP